MLVESWAIIVIILALGFIYVRSGRTNYGFGVLPLTLVPFGYLVSAPLSRYFNDLFQVNANYFRVIVVVTMLVVACVLMAVLANAIKSKVSRHIYIVICSGFTVILSCVFIYDIIM